ncbi:hypothetical protein NKR23_g11429 [Pleurostoma richardsiae]|uniref:DUF5703 domain-containing protein n=1 Tax=Pleurostoma richardsiae TaxID=41990 RepID=A0AA38VGU8_9PEZI|nr:hypothetical protein NKR23_g11429 [Pleurostoma richardsiae]
MPLGGGDIGLNVWAESGDLLFYIAKSGAFDENNSLLKLGRVRLSMSPNPFALNATPFEQHLYINDGCIVFRGADNTMVTLWVDVDTSAIHTEITSSAYLNVTTGFESWRVKGHQMVENEQQGTSWGVVYTTQLPLPYQHPDNVSYVSGGVLSYHHNNDTPLFDFQFAQQNLTKLDSEDFFNPMRNNTFGIFMVSRELEPGTTSQGTYQGTNYTSYNLVSKKLSKSFELVIATAQDQTVDVDSWLSSLITSVSSVAGATQAKTLDWWHSFWDRSYIIINPDSPVTDPGFQVGKNYQYFRYMMACNAKGKFPTRFNGGLFTFDPVLVSNDTRFTPDYRKWSGGTFTAQNQRLLYWPLLKSGDFDIVKQQFDFYQNISPNSRRLGQTYFGLDVGLTSEQIDNTGLPNVYEYNANKYSNGQERTYLYPPGIDFNDYLSWLSDTANEVADMILLANLHSGLDIDPWMPFIEYQLAWFDEFYQKRNGLDNNGTLIIYPASGAETYKLALNPASTVSGLRKTINDILLIKPNLVKEDTSYYREYLARVPATPLHACPGFPDLRCIAPAANYSFTENDEPTAMYVVFPWGEYGLGQPTDLSYAMNTYFNDSQSSGYHGTDGWRQDQIWFARMGLTSQAKANTISRLSDSTTYRFPAFKGPNYDWSPDINHYGSAAIGLQEMLMQTFANNNTQIRLFPAWPADWTGYFKLSAPFETTVSGEILGTNMRGLNVTPDSRRKDVTFGMD